MRAQEAFDTLIRDGVWPFLKARGFRRTRATFHRPDGPNWQVINVQKSAYSDARDVSLEQQWRGGAQRSLTKNRCQAAAAWRFSNGS